MPFLEYLEQNDFGIGQCLYRAFGLLESEHIAVPGNNKAMSCFLFFVLSWGVVLQYSH